MSEIPFVDRREWSASQVKVYVDSLLAEREKLHRERIAHVNDRVEEVGSALGDRIQRQVDQVGQQIDAVSERAALALDASREAVNKSEAATEKRFDAVNEFRAQLADERGSLMRQDVADRTFTALERRMKALESFQAKILGAIGLAMVFMPLITGLVVYLLTRRAIHVTK